MKKGNTGNQAVERLKSVFMLGLSSNLTTFSGLLLVWILIARNGLVSGFWETLLGVLAFTPLFMADAVNHYCLGRIRLEHLKGWDDIQITAGSRTLIAHHYYFFRLVSVVPAYLLAAYALSGLGLTSADNALHLRMAFLAAFVLHFARSTWFLHHCVAPRLPGYGGHRLLWRTLISAVVFYGWFIYFSGRVSSLPEKFLYYSPIFIFLNGVFYFFLNAFMQPLPTRFSLLKPGRITRREAFFSVEILDEEQFANLDNSELINEKAESSSKNLSFTKISNIRLPLLELPLFQAWGSVFLDASGKIALLILDSEVGRGIHRSLISFAEEKVFITTDFGSPQAKFPAHVNYQSFNRNLSEKDLLEKHQKQIEEHSAEDLKNSVCIKLENFARSMIKFLENDAASGKNKLSPNGPIEDAKH